jgi:hypothetical protein
MCVCVCVCVCVCIHVLREGVEEKAEGQPEENDDSNGES